MFTVLNGDGYNCTYFPKNDFTILPPYSLRYYLTMTNSGIWSMKYLWFEELVDVNHLLPEAKPSNLILYPQNLI